MNSPILPPPINYSPGARRSPLVPGRPSVRETQRLLLSKGDAEREAEARAVLLGRTQPSLPEENTTGEQKVGPGKFLGLLMEPHLLSGGYIEMNHSVRGDQPMATALIPFSG